MTATKDSKKNSPPQGKVIEIPKESLPEKITYDVDTLKEFIDFVFDTENLEADENILVWKTGGLVPGFPQPDYLRMFDNLKKATRPNKLYFGTSTTLADPDGNLRNRKVLFKQFYVLVLDDIGTKVPLDKIPAAFKPSYVIETSAGNFQYGYVLAEPLTVREEAEALVQLVYDAGFSDAGGKMATKLVRLPAGVNGKRGDGQNFPVKLISMDKNILWSPADILDTLNIGVSWADVVADGEKIMKERASGRVKLTSWSAIKPELPSFDGSVDEVAEWLYSTDKVKQETPEWLTIECPWADTHSDGNDWASYSPIGWGHPPYASSRNFNCFHEHCRMRKTIDFLDYVSEMGGPNMPVRDHAHELVSRYAFDEFDMGVWDIQRDGQPAHIKMDAFNYLHPHKVTVPLYDGKKIKISETALFRSAKSRVVVSGPTYDPTTPAKIVQHGKHLHTNLYTQPEWGDGDYDQKDLFMFTQFIDYLIPHEESREFFLDWLAAKAQSMAFRGPAMLMIAPSQGTGRTTLGNMLAQLFGSENVERVPFERLAGGGGTFNDWIVKPIIITDETLALGNEDNYYKVYERLKELIDTTPQEVRVNPKYGKQRFQMTYSSFMLFSNHENAMKVADNDRRLYVINNPTEPASPEYFGLLNAWIAKGNWPRAVWRWLRKREVDVAKLNAPPSRTKAKDDMMQASKQAIDIAVEAVLNNWPTAQISAFQVKDLLASFTMRFELKDPSIAARMIQRNFTKHTFAVDGKHRINDRTVRVRLIKGRDCDPWFSPTEIVFEMGEIRESMLKIVEDELTGNDF